MQIGAITVGGVVGQCGGHEAAQTCLRGGFPGLPFPAQSACPIRGMGLQAQGAEGDAREGGMPWRRLKLQATRSTEWPLRCDAGHGSAPIGGKHPEGLARLVGESPGLVEKPTVECFHPHAALFQEGFDC